MDKEGQSTTFVSTSVLSDKCVIRCVDGFRFSSHFCLLNCRYKDFLPFHIMEQFINFSDDAIDVILQNSGVVASVGEEVALRGVRGWG